MFQAWLNLADALNLDTVERINVVIGELAPLFIDVDDYTEFKERAREMYEAIEHPHVVMATALRYIADVEKYHLKYKKELNEVGLAGSNSSSSF